MQRKNLLHPVPIPVKVDQYTVTMPSSNLVALAAGVRKALASPIIAATKDEAGRRARKQLIDTLPDLQRALVGPKEAIVRATWSVSENFTIGLLRNLPNWH